MEQIKENDFNIKRGMYDFRLDEEPALHSLTYIFTDLKDIKQAYFKLGFHLNEFNQNRYYENLGFLTFKEFCTANLPLEYKTVARCIQVFKMICQRNGSTPTMFIDDKFKGFGYSQLCEMVSIKNDEYRDMVTPSMTIKQIRDMKKGKMSSRDVATDKKNVSKAPKNSAIREAFEKKDYFDVIIALEKYLLVELGSGMSQTSYTCKCLFFKFDGVDYKLQLSTTKKESE